MKWWGELEKNCIHRIQHDMLLRKWLTRFRERSGAKRKQSYMFSWLGPSDISEAKTKSPILMEKYEQLIISHKYLKMHKITRENKYFLLYKLKLFKKNQQNCIIIYLKYSKIYFCPVIPQIDIMEYPGTFQVYLLLRPDSSQINFISLYLSIPLSNLTVFSIIHFCSLFSVFFFFTCTDIDCYNRQKFPYFTNSKLFIIYLLCSNRCSKSYDIICFI